MYYLCVYIRLVQRRPCRSIVMPKRMLLSISMAYNLELIEALDCGINSKIISSSNIKKLSVYASQWETDFGLLSLVACVFVHHSLIICEDNTH